MKPAIQQALQRTIFWSKIGNSLIAAIIVMQMVVIAIHLMHYPMGDFDMPYKIAVLGLFVAIYGLYNGIQYTRFTRMFLQMRTNEHLTQATYYERRFWYTLAALIMVAFGIFLSMILEF